MALRSPQPKTARRMGVLFIVFIFLTVFIIAFAGATPPPPEYRAAYLLPYLGDINTSVSDYLNVTDEGVPLFPPLSPYFASQNILDEKTGEHYVSEVWYFTDENEFTAERALLINYLAFNGRVSNTTLNITPELSQFSSYPGADEYTQIHHIPALEYDSNSSSGYFVMLPEDYPVYIAYYGIAGSDHLDEQSTLLKILIMSTVAPYMWVPSPQPPPQISLSLTPFGEIFLIGFGLLVLLILVRRKG